MKSPLCRLCQHNHGLSEPHVFAGLKSETVLPERASEERVESKQSRGARVSPATAMRRPLETVEPARTQSGGSIPRRAKASGPVIPPEKTADDVVPPQLVQAQSAGPSQSLRKDSIAALRKLLTKGLPAAERRELNDLISKLEARRSTKRLSMQRYRKNLKKRNAA